MVVAAFYLPDSPTSGSILLSSLGIVAVVVGIFALRARHRGLERRAWPARAGVLLGALATASTAAAIINSSYGTTLPTLPDATRTVVTAMTASQDATPPVVVDAPVLAPPASAPGDEPIVAAPTPVFATAEEEFAHLTRSLGTTVFLIRQLHGDGSPDAIWASETGYPYVDETGRVMIESSDSILAGFIRLPDGRYSLTLTSAQFGTSVVYDSRAGVIERG